MLTISGVSTLGNVLQLLGLIIVFILILVATYYTTKFVGSANMMHNRNSNISLVETYRINQNKYIQIIKVGGKYIVVGVSKDHIEYLTEIEEEQLIFSEQNGKPVVDFKTVFSQVKDNVMKKKQ
jgi:flagellar biosynthetic protein FliO